MSDPPLTPLVRAYLDRRADLVRAFTARLRSASRAEDLVQSMFEKVVGAPAGEAIGNPDAYLYRLGMNLMLDEVRQVRRRVARDSAWSDLQGESLGAMRAADAPSPERTAQARERLQHLLQKVETLPPQTRRVFRMHKLEGMSHAETARALGVSKSAVEKHVSLALRLLTERDA